LIRPHPSARRGASARTLRIIGGTWRGRRLRFPPSPEIRPTPDRVRETLFNWLAARVPGARCLDLFAGSGALGLEALSRGASHVTFVERDLTAAREISARLTDWGARGANVEHTDARRFLEQTPTAPFDIVFLDPPFASTLVDETAARLEQGGWLADNALVYVECPADAAASSPATSAKSHGAARTLPADAKPHDHAAKVPAGAAPPVPGGWALLKAKQAGEVGYHLYSRDVRGTDAE
jgi:16S rRNA (guanine966-N2)-methyltransferase